MDSDSEWTDSSKPSIDEEMYSFRKSSYYDPEYCQVRDLLIGKPPIESGNGKISQDERPELPPSLLTLAAGVVGRTMAFEEVEAFSAAVKIVPENVQLSIMKAAFPTNKAVISRCVYLSRKTQFFEEIYSQSECAYKRVLTDAKQIGYTIHGKVTENSSFTASANFATVLISFDRCRIISTSCSKHRDTAWCPHVVHAIFRRIDHPSKFEYYLPITDSLQMLNELQQKQFISIMLSKFQLELLGPAQEVLNQFLRPASSELPLEQQGLVDPTAGGSTDMNPSWLLDLEDSLQYSHPSFKALGRNQSSDSISRCFSEGWVQSIEARKQPRPFRPLPLINFSMSARKSLDDFLWLSREFIKEGDSIGLDVLSAVSEKWLEWLRCELNSHMLVKMPRVSEDLPTFAARDYCKNRCLVSCHSSDYYFPDKLALCLQLAALCPSFSSSERKELHSDLLKWAGRLDKCVLDGQGVQERIEAFAGSPSDAYFSGKSHQKLLNGLQGWNGFAHVAELLSSDAAAILRHPAGYMYETGNKFAHHVQFETSAAVDPKFLRTVCVLINGFKFFKQERAAQLLAFATCVRFIEAMGVKQVEGEGAEKAGEGDSILLAIQQLHATAGNGMWGERRDDDLLTPLLVLWDSVLEIDQDVYSNTFFSLSSLLQSGDQCSVKLPWKTALALLCLLRNSMICGGGSTMKRCNHTIDGFIGRNSMIAYVSQHVEDHGGKVFREMLRKEVMEMSSHQSAPFIILDSLFGASRLCKEDCLTADSQFSAVVVSHFRSQTEEINALLQKGNFTTSVDCCEFFNSLCDWSLALLHSLLLSSNKEQALEEIASILLLPLRSQAGDASLLQQAATRRDINFICYINYSLDILLSFFNRSWIGEDRHTYSTFSQLNLGCAVDMFFSEKAFHSMEGSNIVCCKIAVRVLFCTLVRLNRFTNQYCYNYYPGCKERVLKYLQASRKTVGMTCFLAMWEKETEGKWASIAEADQICDYLLCEEEEELETAQCHAQVFSLLTELTACEREHSTCVMEVIKRLNATDKVIGNVLSNLEQSEKTLSYDMLFLLARESHVAEDALESAKKRFRLAVAGVRQYRHFVESEKDVLRLRCSYPSPSTSKEWRVETSFISLLVGLACYIDHSEQRRDVDPRPLPCLSGLFLAVADAWIDPLFAFLIAIQAAHLAYSPDEAALAMSPMQENSRSVPFPSVAEFDTAKQDMCVRKMCDEVENAYSIIARCKEIYLKKLQRMDKNADEKSNDAESLFRDFPLSSDDLVALNILLRVFPEKSVHLKELLMNAGMGSLSAQERKAIKRFRRYMYLKSTEGYNDDSAESDMASDSSSVDEWTSVGTTSLSEDECSCY